MIKTLPQKKERGGEGRQYFATKVLMFYRLGVRLIGSHTEYLWKSGFLFLYMLHTVLFTSDIHGNESQYRKLVEYAVEISAKSIVIGGDIAPLSLPYDQIITGQRIFLEERLPRLLSPLRDELSDSKIFLMMGNDDCAANLDVLETNDPSMFTLIHRRRTALSPEYDIVGYSYVPITPFGIKDWEKFDFSEVPKNLAENYKLRKATNYELSGYKSSSGVWEKFRFASNMEKEDSIQKDLSSNMFCQDADRTIYVFHTPPNDTKLDMVYDGSHVGSMALGLFITKHQPYMTLHGHVHETVDCSGSHAQEIGHTLCLTAGNNPHTSELAVLVFDLYNPTNVTRRII